MGRRLASLSTDCCIACDVDIHEHVSHPPTPSLSPRHCIIPSWLRARGRVQGLNAESVLKKACLVRCRSLSCLSPSWVGSHRPHTPQSSRSGDARRQRVSAQAETRAETRAPGPCHTRSRTRPGHSAAPPGPRAHREMARARSALGLAASPLARREPGRDAASAAYSAPTRAAPRPTPEPEALSPSLRACAAHRCGRARRGALDPRPRPRLRPRSAPAFRNTVVANPREARVKGTHTWLRENAKRKGAA